MRLSPTCGARASSVRLDTDPFDPLWTLSGRRWLSRTRRDPLGPAPALSDRHSSSQASAELLEEHSGADPGFLPGEGAKGLITLYGIRMIDF